MQNILFLCPHGGAKSVIAAAYFNAIGLPFTATAAAAEEPYDAVPEPVVALLARDAVDVRAFTPRRVTDDDVNEAVRVIRIDCNGEGEHWDDVPKASEDLEGSAAAIRRHVDALAAELRGRD